MAGTVDWAAVWERLRAAEEALRRAEPTDRQREVIFARRAEQLAAPPPAEAPSDAFAALVFDLGPERYAVPVAQVREVRAVDRLTPLPSAPPFVAGLVNVRGRIVPVLDLRPLFAAAAVEAIQSGDRGYTVVLLAGPRGDAGILATGRPTVAWLRASELGALPLPSALDPVYVRGVTPDFVVVLDGLRLLADPRLVVDQEIQ